MYTEVELHHVGMLLHISPRPDLLSVGPCSEKNVGPLYLFFLEKNGDLFLFLFFCLIITRVSAVSSPEKLAAFFAHNSRSLGGRPLFRYFGHAKNLPLLLWGPLFEGARVRPNMLNMLKSAAVFHHHSVTEVAGKSTS